MDMAWAFLSQIVGQGDTTFADMASNILEYDVHKDPSWDPYCEVSIAALVPE
jgi:hypothetical protein